MRSESSLQGLPVDQVRTVMENNTGIISDLQSRFGDALVAEQKTSDGIPTVWVVEDALCGILPYLKTEVERPYRMLYDLTVIDERARINRQGQPESDFTVLYHLLSFDRNEDIRIKVALKGEHPSIKTITGIWPAASWYEREAWDMFGVTFEDHPHLRRILMPPTWKGHPLRKEHPARATEMEPFVLPEDTELEAQQALEFGRAMFKR